jgi:hypothetical protein
VLCFYGLTVLLIDTLLFNVFTAASMSYNSFSLSHGLIFNFNSIPAGLYVFVYMFLALAFIGPSLLLASFHLAPKSSGPASALPRVTISFSQYLNLLSVSYFNYIVLLIESVVASSSISYTFAYSFIPLALALFFLF